MGNIYTIIKHREDSADYCRGCLMDSSEGEFDLVITDNSDQAISYVTAYLSDGMAWTNPDLNSKYLAYATTDVILMINGWSPGRDWNVDENFVIPEEWEKEYSEIIAEANRRATLNIEHRVAEKKEQKQRKNKADADQQRRNELHRLAELKAKYEGGDNGK